MQYKTQRIMNSFEVRQGAEQVFDTVLRINP